MIKSLAILTTYFCNAECDFCECGPNVKGKISLNDMINHINEAYSLGTVGQVVFTGGEPTFLGDTLFKAISHANSLGMLTRVVTNGWWGKSAKRADYIVGQLQKAGLSEINISVDDLHQQWIPLKHVKNAFHGCLRAKLNCLIAHKSYKKAKITKEYLENYFEVNLIDYVDNKEYSPDEQLRLISSGGIVPVGRKPTIPIKEDDLLYSNCNRSCPAVLKDIVVDPEHNVLPCCGIVTKQLPELTLGNLKERRMIDILIDANKNLILNWIALEGPASIAKFIMSIDPSIKFKKKYVNECHLCNEILSRKEIRQLLHEHNHKMVDRISLHRALFERVRSDKEIMEMYE